MFTESAVITDHSYAARNGIHKIFKIFFTYIFYGIRQQNNFCILSVSDQIQCQILCAEYNIVVIKQIKLTKIFNNCIEEK